jgi:nitroreductase
MEVGEAMRTTGTCRHFSGDPVPDDVLYRALDSARFGPQGGNRQPIRWVVVRDPAKKRRLAGLYLPYWQAYYNAISLGSMSVGAVPKTVESANEFAHNLAEVPALVVVCADVAGLHPTDAELGRISVVGGASIYPVMQNFCLALRAEGVASAVTTLLCHEEPAVRELLGIPDDVITAAHIAVGYPRRGFPTRLNRCPVEEVVYLDHFGKPLFAAPAGCPAQ